MSVGAKIFLKMCAKKVIFGILLHKIVKMVDMHEALLMIQ